MQVESKPSLPYYPSRETSRARGGRILRSGPSNLHPKIGSSRIGSDITIIGVHSASSPSLSNGNEEEKFNQKLENFQDVSGCKKLRYQ